MPGRSRLLVALALLGLSAPAGGRAQRLDDANELYAAGRLAAAERAYRAVAERDATRDPDAAGAARNNLCVLLMGSGRLEQARPECIAALPLRRAAADESGLAQTLNNLGLVEQYLGATTDAEGHFGEALALNRRLGEAESAAINLANLGLLRSSAGRYREALAAYREVETVATATTEPWGAEQLRVARINEGVVLEKLGEYTAALELLLSVRREESALEPSRRAALAANLGVLYRNLGDAERAADELDRAAADYRRLGDSAALANALLSRGLVAELNLGDAAPAEALYREALALAAASGDRGEEVQDLFYLGRLLIAGHRYEEAETSLTRALDLATSSGSAEGRWSALDGLGRLAAARGDLEAAARLLTQALAIIEEVRAGLVEGAQRAGFFGDKRSVYAAAVAVEIERDRRAPGVGHDAAAYGLAERAKARDLLDALGEKAGPAARPRTAAEVLARLGDTPLLELFVGDSQVFAWWLSSAGLRALPPQPAAPLLAATERLHRRLVRGEEPDDAVLAELGARLLGPIAGDLRGARALRVAADGRLRYLPFELLPLAEGARVVDAIAISYLPTGSLLVDPTPPRRPLEIELLAFGDPESSASRAAGFAPLPASSAELDALGEWLSGPRELLRGRAATEAAWRAASRRGSRIVHFATHTVIDERPGRGAAILLTPAGEDDGLLEPAEIAAGPPAAGLTVLSGCRTALGSAEDGRALSTLTGAFLAAGTPAVVASLWDVGDRASAAFMTQLYAELGRGAPPAEALALVKRRLRADPAWNRAALWAPWVLIGEAPAPLAAPGARRGRRLAAAGLTLAAAALALWAWPRRSRAGGLSAAPRQLRPPDAR